MFVGVTPAALIPMYQLVLDQGVCLVADAGDRLAGFLALVALPHPLTGQLYGDEIAWWVEPEYRRGRVGPQLLVAAEQWARQMGCQSVKMVAPFKSTVGAFYERCGYTAVETAYAKQLCSEAQLPTNQGRANGDAASGGDEAADSP